MLIKLTEYKRVKAGLSGVGNVEEAVLLVNPVGIESVAEGDFDKEEIPIIGEHSVLTIRGMTMRSGRKHAIKESFEEIEKLMNAAPINFSE